MSKAEQLYVEIGKSFKGAEESQMFGKPCFKINKKAFVCFFKECMVFKLTDKEHASALSMDGAELFDPSGKKRPMKEWVQLPYDYRSKWKAFAMAAFEYVRENS